MFHCMPYASVCDSVQTRSITSFLFQAPVRRIRSVGPSGPGAGDHPGRGGQGGGRSLTQGRRAPPHLQEDPDLRREVEELRARTANMEKTMRSVLSSSVVAQ